MRTEIIICEEAIRSLVLRIDRAEREIEALKESKKNFNKNPTVKIHYNGEATEGQVRYIKTLGGVIKDGLTKKEAGVLIDELLEKKNQKKMEGSVQEPEEVETDDVGLNEDGTYE